MGGAKIWLMEGAGVRKGLGIGMALTWFGGNAILGGVAVRFAGGGGYLSQDDLIERPVAGWIWWVGGTVFAIGALIS